MKSPSFSRSASSTTSTIRPCADVLDRLRDRGEDRRGRGPSARRLVTSQLLRHAVASVSIRRSTYFAIMSTSRFTGSPGAAEPSVVTRQRVRDQRDADPVGMQARDGEAHAVDRDRALLDHVPRRGPAATGTGAATPPSLVRARRARTSPTPSTWPCTMWPPSRAASVTGRSRLTGSPARAGAGSCARSSPRRGRSERRGVVARPP